MTKKSKSKGTIEPVIDTDEVEITLTQNILDQINSFSQKKQLRQTVSPSGTNIPLDVLLSNGNTETTTSNNSQNNELRDSQNGKNEEGQKKGPPPPVPKRNTTDTEIKSNPKNFFPPPPPIMEVIEEDPKIKSTPKNTPKIYDQLPPPPPLVQQTSQKTMKQKPVNKKLEGIGLIEELDVNSVSDDISSLNIDLSSLITDMDNFENDMVLDNNSSSLIDETFNNLINSLKEHDLSDLNVMEVDIDKLKI